MGGAEASALITTEVEIERAIALKDPVWWIENKLHEFAWSKQRQIFESVRDNRRTAVMSCHTIGKSWTAARTICWWIGNHRPGDAFAVTSAPTFRQVQAVLWRELRRAHAAGDLPGRTNQTEWLMVGEDGVEQLVAFGQKPADTDPSAFQGIHARYVLVVLDEACGVPALLWEAADTLISNADSRILAIGNPDDPNTVFGDVCKPGSGWNVIQVSAFDTPTFKGEPVPDRLKEMLIGPTWVEEKRKSWGEDNPFYISKVLGQFPDVSEGGLIPLSWIRNAMNRTLKPGRPVELGVDVGGGGDKSVIARREGPVVRIVRRDQNPNTMETTGNIISVLEDPELPAEVAKIDEIGIGKGVVDRAAELKKSIQGVNVGTAANDSENFKNLRAEGYWGLRERFEEGSIDIDPEDEDLAAQLADLKVKRTSSGKIQIESKDEIRRRTGRSPDEADAVMLAFIVPISNKKTKATWGRD